MLAKEHGGSLGVLERCCVLAPALYTALAEQQQLDDWEFRRWMAKDGTEVRAAREAGIVNAWRPLVALQAAPLAPACPQALKCATDPSQDVASQLQRVDYLLVPMLSPTAASLLVVCAKGQALLHLDSQASCPAECCTACVRQYWQT